MMRYFTLWLMLFCSFPALALDVSALGGLPVLHEGRMKPLETFARLSLGGLKAKDKNDIELLAMAMFTPADALNEPLFVIQSPALRSLLKLPENANQPYRYIDVTPALRQHTQLLSQLADKPSSQYSAHEQGLWQLYLQVDRLTQVTGSLSLLLPIDMPLSDALKRRFDVAAKPPYSYRSLSAYQGAMQKALKEVIAKKGASITRYSADEQELAMVSMQLRNLAATGEGNQLLRIMPNPWQQGEWLSPWQMLQSGKASPESAPLYALWQQAAIAYQSDDDAAWDDAMQQLREGLVASQDISSLRLRLEQAYYQLDLLSVAIGFYMLSLLLGLWRRRKGAMTSLLLALGVHSAMIAARVMILQRPPVSTLYESVLFVALVAALIGAVMARRLPLAAMVGAGVAAFLLAISGIYVGDGDPMSMPMAVLNTNFWLATHVIIITSGYGASLVAGVLAHLALWRREAAATRYLQGAALLALLLTAVGTILGGVWADQSWGRFWGWDPKENGALLITVWLAWLLHARMTSYMGARGFAALLAATNITVGLSWFGVNLLGVGLHSYGFTSAAALGLAGFCIGEILLISGLYFRAKERQKI